MNDAEKEFEAQLANPKITRSKFLKLFGLGAISGAIIGQAIDNAYPMSGALHYYNGIYVPFFGQILEFVWWVPLLYAIAGGGIVTLIYLFTNLFSRRTGTFLDGWKRQKPRGGYDPSWAFIIASILVYVVQWFLGCHLSIFIPNSWLFAILVIWGFLNWYIFDGTDAGLLLCFMVCTLGPLLEIFLINGLGWYVYTRPDIFGVPLWFMGHYFGGTPANMNLSRKYQAWLQRKESNKASEIIKNVPSLA